MGRPNPTATAGTIGHNPVGQPNPTATAGTIG